MLIDVNKTEDPEGFLEWLYKEGHTMPVVPDGVFAYEYDYKMYLYLSKKMKRAGKDDFS